MKKILVIIILFAFYNANCQKDKTLVGVPENKSNHKKNTPEGMTFIPMGSYSILRVPGDSTSKVTKSVQAFYMSQEVTNKEYRQYMDWLKSHPDDTLSWVYIDHKAMTKPYENDTTTEGWKSRRQSRIKIINVLTKDIKPIDLSVWDEFKDDNCYELYKNYFTDPAFDNFPVVGVSWENARLFCQWKTKMLNDKALADGKEYYNDVRLPAIEEWEYASACGFTGKDKNIKKQITLKDGREYLNQIPLFPSVSNKKNLYGLYNLNQNVAEWTSNSYDESAYLSSNSGDLSPDYFYEAKPGDPPALKRKLVTGDSWFKKNEGLQFEYQDKARAFIGFRYVTTYYVPSSNIYY